MYSFPLTSHTREPWPLRTTNACSSSRRRLPSVPPGSTTGGLGHQGACSSGVRLRLLMRRFSHRRAAVRLAAGDSIPIRGRAKLP